MTRLIEVQAVAPATWTQNQALRRILEAALARRLVPATPHEGPYWSASYFGLDQVKLFKESSTEEQQAVLKACSRGLLEEAWSIEKLGLCFTAKMVLLARTDEERALYSLFAADEAAHFYAITPFIDSTSQQPVPSPFLKLLAEIVESGNRTTLTYLIQVVLEGWGLHHYQSIADAAQEESLAAALRGIVQDEALHHGSGLTLFNEHAPSLPDRECIAELLVRLFSMVQAGPQGVVSALEQVKGHLSHSQKIRVFEDLRCEEKTNRNLQHLSALMKGPQSDPLIATLRERGALRPYTPKECAYV